MTSFRFRQFAILIIFLAGVSSISCSTKTEGQKRFGADADYFIGLKLLSEGNEKQARLKFNKCIKKGSYYCAKKSAQALCTFGNIQEKNQAAENLIKLYPEKDSLLLAAKQFESSNEINKLLECTQNLNPVSDKNELIKIRLTALKNRGDSSYEQEVYDWFASCPVSKEHYQFYRDTYEHPDFEEAYTYNQLHEEKMPLRYTPEQFAINYRIELYKRNYTYTLDSAPELIKYMQSGALNSCEQLASDIGKSYLYGSMDFANNAAYFKKLGGEAELSENGKNLAFYYWFYAGRLYEKAGVYYKQTKNAFEKAMETANNPSQKDNALWYLLNNSMNFSVDSIIENISLYAPQWNDPEYFEDIFEKLISSLLASGKWDAFYKIYTAADGFASDETVAQYAYIYGRLVEEGLAKGDDEAVKKAYTRALTSGSSMYYKILAAYKLGLKGSDLEKVLTAPYKVNTNAQLQADAKTLLEGYAFFGFPQLIYPAWQELYTKGLPEETYFYLADFLGQVGKTDSSENYFTQGTRIAARGQSMAGRNLSRQEIRQIYPLPYFDIVENYCKKYDIKPSVIYALIRSESFFDAEVTSTAGAIGLTQLMEFTGSDIAKRLKIQDYDLTDPEISINFGTYYLAELVRRCDGSMLQAFFSYNAGITRVRRWLKSSLIEFGKKSNMPSDLYLETVPYTETREYGRKLVSATVMYEWLEDENNFAPAVEELLK